MGACQPLRIIFVCFLLIFLTALSSYSSTSQYLTSRRTVSTKSWRVYCTLLTMFVMIILEFKSDQYPCLNTPDTPIIQIMNFHQLEEQAVLHDACDNQKIEKIVKELREMKEKYAFAMHQIEELTAQVAQLTELNKTLQVASNHYNSHFISPKHELPLKEAHLFSHTAFPFSMAAPPSMHVQQTKRKVISGFVTELTNELESSEQLLAQERRMHEELRRSLEESHSEAIALKNANRALEHQVASMLYENRQLMGEVSELQGRIEALKREMDRVTVRDGWQREALLRRADEVEQQFLLMDRIYHQIQIQISSK